MTGIHCGLGLAMSAGLCSTPSAMANPTNVLSTGIEITGSIRFSNDMIIDGKVDGEMTSDKGRVTINPLFPASGPATGSFNDLHAKSKFLAPPLPGSPGERQR
jgi:hypothetical protein